MSDDDNRTKATGGIGTWAFFLILWTCLGYFLYDGINGAVAIALLWALYALALAISLIPFVGAIIQGVVMYLVVWPWLSSFTGIAGSWLTTVMFGSALIGGIFITIVITVYILFYRD